MIKKRLENIFISAGILLILFFTAF